MSRFKEEIRKSEKYKEVVETIRKIIEENGIDEANRAYADAVHESLLRLFCQENDMRKSASKAHKNTLCTKMSGNFLDHREAFLNMNSVKAVISHPYYLDLEDLKKMVESCENKKLDVFIDTKSWYFPSRTMRVIFTRIGTKIGRFFAE